MNIFIYISTYTQKQTCPCLMIILFFVSVINYLPVLCVYSILVPFLQIMIFMNIIIILYYTSETDMCLWLSIFA